MSNAKEVNPALDAELESLARGIWKWRLIALLFFIPYLFYVLAQEKRLNEAVTARDPVAAHTAADKMKISALVSVILGVPLLIPHVSVRF